MGVARQLYQLQEIDLEIESDERELRLKVSQLGENQAVVKAQDRLKEKQQKLDELKHQQHTAEWEIDDLEGKIAPAEEKLYSGRVTNPKELASLQHEVGIFKSRRDQLESKALEVMEQVEQAEADAAEAGSELKKIEGEWNLQQQHLSAEIEQLKKKIADLEQKRQLLSAEIEAEAVECYQRLRKQRGQAVAKVEQGVCRGCRISLPSSDIQRVRSGNLVQCSSCSRILYLP